MCQFLLCFKTISVYGSQFCGTVIQTRLTGDFSGLSWTHAGFSQLLISFWWLLAGMMMAAGHVFLNTQQASLDSLTQQLWKDPRQWADAWKDLRPRGGQHHCPALLANLKGSQISEERKWIWPLNGKSDKTTAKGYRARCRVGASFTSYHREGDEEVRQILPLLVS